MKKLGYAMALILPVAILANFSDASAQRKNTTNHDVPPSTMEKMENKAGDMYDSMAKSVKGGWQDVKHGAQKMMGDDDSKKMNCGCNKDKACMGNCMDKMKKHWMEKKTADISEEYNEAIQKISQSSFSPVQKDLLIKQANENQDLALSQIKARSEMRSKHRQQRMDFDMQNMLSEKANRKAIKKLEDID